MANSALTLTRRNLLAGTAAAAVTVALAACNRSVGNVKETWAIQQTPHGDVFVVYFAGEDMAHVFQYFAASQDSFDCWVKEQVRLTTGADLNTPPAGPLSEILADYQA